MNQVWKILAVRLAIALVAGTCGLFSARCSSTPVADTETPPSSVSQIPQSVPRNADLVMRVDADWAYSVLMEQAAEPGAPTIMGGRRRDVSLRDLIEEFPLVDSLTEYGEFIFDERWSMASYLDYDESIWIAISWDGADEMIADLERGITPDYIEMITVEGQVRLVVPMTDIKAAQGEIEAECGSELEEYECRNVRAWSTEAGYAVFDFGLFPGQAMRVAAGEGQNRLFSRQTVAARAFHEGDGPLAIYMTMDRPVDLSVLAESNDIFHALEASTRSRRSEFWYRGLSAMVAKAAMKSPRAGEYEDLTVLVDDDLRRPVFEFHQSHSARGGQVFEAAQAGIDLPAIPISEPGLTFEWQAPSPSARDQAVAPGWMVNYAASDQGLSHYTDFLRRGGLAAIFYPLLAYPTGWASGLGQFDLDLSEPPGQALAIKESLVAVRASLAVAADETRSTGYELEGGLVLAVTRQTSGAQQLQNIIEVAEERGALADRGLQVTWRDQGPHRLFMIGSGDHAETFGEAVDVKNLRFGVDVAALHGAATDTPMASDLREVASVIPQLAITRAATSSGAVTRFEIGRVNGAAPTVFDGTARPVALDRRSDCFYDAANDSQAIFTQFLAALPDEQQVVLRRRTSQFLETLEDCQAEDISAEEAQILDAMGTYWTNFSADDIPLASPEEIRRRLEDWQKRHNEAPD